MFAEKKMCADRDEVYKVTREVLDKEGVGGIPRITYYSFALRLARLLRRAPREDWSKTIEALIVLYKYSHGARKTVMRKIASALVKHCFSPSQPRPPA